MNKENLAIGGKVVLRSRCLSQNPNATRSRIEMTSKVGTSDVSPFSLITWMTKREIEGGKEEDKGMTYKE